MKIKVIASLLASIYFTAAPASVFSTQDKNNGIEVKSKYDFTFEMSGMGLKPIQIFTDGNKTWVQLTDVNRVPLFFVNNKPIGYTMDGFLLVIDGLHQEMNMLDATTNKNTLVTYSGVYSTGGAGVLHEVANPIALNGVAEMPLEFRAEKEPKVPLVQPAQVDTKVQPAKKERVKESDYNFKFEVEGKSDAGQAVYNDKSIYAPAPIEVKPKKPVTSNKTKSLDGVVTIVSVVSVSPQESKSFHAQSPVTPHQAAKSRQVSGGVIRKASRSSSGGFTVEATSSKAVPVFDASTVKVASIAPVHVPKKNVSTEPRIEVAYSYQAPSQNYKTQHPEDSPQVQMYKAMSGTFMVEKVNVAAVSTDTMVDVPANMLPPNEGVLRVEGNKNGHSISIKTSVVEEIQGLISEGFKLVITGHAGMMSEAKRVLRSNARAISAMNELVKAGVSKDALMLNKIKSHKDPKDWSGVDLKITR